jgi:hypothetical protein
MGFDGASAALIAAMLLTVLGALSCKSRRAERSPQEHPLLGSVGVRKTGGAKVRGLAIELDSSRIVAKARSTLEGSGLFAAPTKSKALANVSLDLDVLGEGSGDPPEIGVKVHLRVDVRPTDTVSGRYAEDTVAIGQVPLARGPAGDLGGAFQRLAERTTEDLLLAYAARKRLWLAEGSEVVKTLTSEEGELRLAAIRVAGVRQLRAAMPSILHLLSDDDEATRDAALGAVVAMGDRSAIKALAESRSMRDSYEMRKVLDAVASLGGREAKEYLSFVAETHDDPEIRAMAREAGERVGKHDVSGSPTR